MALSNWDTLAFGNDGKPCNGVLEGFDGQSIEIYKNWAYVRDPKGWHKGLGFVEPTVAQIGHGSMTVGHFSISARRGPQESIFLYAECSRYPKKGEPEHRRIAGIGAYGFDDPTPKVAAKLGINLKDYDDCIHSTSIGGNRSPEAHLMLIKGGELVREESVPETPDITSQWTGVTRNTYRAFMRWLRKHLGKSPEYDKEFFAWYELCKKNGPLRFCQGDGYFASHAGIGLNATPPGKADAPILMQAFGTKNAEDSGGEEGE